ncbi:ligase-associated DNA damage response DEXH box helicase [Neolewinella persica]|uniref:ligase-associated DNA damage response DEXH box helicase n=1 Tax=Neolewinella persica TaxID=70998 RepID=UPI000371BAAC|nr:ligase-associated DNA damage response DEXH box helicase [Neolewinella persica]
MTRKEQIEIGSRWFQQKGWTPFPFQVQTWKAYLQGKNGVVNAATGSGKTYALLVPILLEFIAKHQKKKKIPAQNGLQAIWISPIKALTKEIKLSAEQAIEALGLNWKVAIRSGDTSSAERAKIKKRPPEILITTPESLHLLLATAGYEDFFNNLKVFVADEWHELLGSKRGVQVELALSRLKALLPNLKVWGISATIGNMEDAAAVLFGADYKKDNWKLIRSKIEKKIDIQPVLPDDIERFPWAGHLGIFLAEKVLDIVNDSTTTLLFTNTRNQCERWYQELLALQPDLAGLIAMHHSAIARTQRDWVEEALHEGKLKLVVCTSSLDLGVDFRPVKTVIQIGSPKGVARFLQRAGRSGHQPGATSVVHFVPTHALELVESAALRRAVARKNLESRIPYIRSFDVLVQYLVTLSVSGGFDALQIYEEVKKTYSYESVTPEEWDWCLAFICTGGTSLDAYDEYNRVGLYKGKYYIVNKAMATRHRLSIGTIVSDTMVEVKYRNGSKIGRVEERFISGLRPGDVFMFSGKVLELVRFRGIEARVKASKKKRGITPSWAGGRMPFSSQLSEELRHQMTLIQRDDLSSQELKKLRPLTDIQKKRSGIPAENELLIEYFKDREGYHLLFYPFEGRFIHEGLSTLIAWRISQQIKITFTIAVNDYGFELLSDQSIDLETVLKPGLFTTENLKEDILESVNAVEMAKRRFRDIASIAGLIYKGYPGMQKSTRHLQSSSQLFFEVFQQHEPDNLLVKQANEEVMRFQLEENRLRSTLDRLTELELMIKSINRPAPLTFPIIVDRLREKVSSETLRERISKMKLKIIR